MAGRTHQLKWTLGVVTAPRQGDNYLEKTLDSIRRAGFSDPVVFAEPGLFVPGSFSGSVVQRRKRFGDWSNWASGLYELLLTEPDTDYFMMLEDDCVMCSTVKQYLEYSIPYLEPFGSLSLYTPSIYHKNNFRGFHNELRGHRTWSTVTVIMSRQNIVSFFSDSDVQRHRFDDVFGEEDQFWACAKTDPRNSIKDAIIGHWASKNNFPVYFHTPSLAQHIGIESTISNEIASADNGRMAFDFVGEEADLEPWLSEPVTVRKFVRIPQL